MRRALFLASVTTLMTGLSGCTNSKPAAKQPVVVGVVLPLTGTDAAYGVSARSGIELAVIQINAAGGVLDRRVQAIFIDDQSDQDQAVSATQRLITKEKARLIIGELSSGPSMAMAQIAQRARIPMISPSATAPELTKNGPFVFRTCFVDPLQAEVMAEYVAGDLHLKKVGVLRDLGSTYAMNLAEAFSKKVERLGVEVVLVSDFSTEDSSFEAPLQALTDAGAQAVYLPSYASQVGRILGAAQSMKVPFRFLGSDGWDNSELLSSGLMQGHLFVSHFTATQGEASTFVSAYQERFNERPDSHAALGFDSIMIAVDAIRRAKKTDGEAIRDALSQTKDFGGVTGRISFAANGDPTKSAVILEVEAKQAKLLKVWTP